MKPFSLTQIDDRVGVSRPLDDGIFPIAPCGREPSGAKHP
ncbi:hypothetical protein D779_3093 [Imhoffiella purpurea]|uniref:Uncharacterized protein n=1 Tax=Imhoffiella purpurea TaxID=1249627 RepID=W9V3E3_9GAMM|nr:hypothetical protein D779_3093 [Imhoffiella purpurea]